MIKRVGPDEALSGKGDKAVGEKLKALLVVTPVDFI